MTKRGPVYNVELLKTLPLGNTGMLQAMPDGDELTVVRQRSERTVAAYEVLTNAYRKLHAAALAARLAFDAFASSDSWNGPELETLEEAIGKLPEDVL